MSEEPVCPPAANEPPEPSPAESRLAKESEVGWAICGINGCILADRHPGGCLFPDIQGARRRKAVDLKGGIDLDAPQLLSKGPKPAAKEPAAAEVKEVALPATAGKRKSGAKPASKAKAAKTPSSSSSKAAAGDAAAPAGAAADDDEDVACVKCGSRGDEEAMMLCDGAQSPMISRAPM